MNLSLILIIIGILGFALNRKSMILMLISIEIMLLAITFLILISSLSFDNILGQTAGLQLMYLNTHNTGYLINNIGSRFEPINNELDTSIEGIYPIVGDIFYEVSQFNDYLYTCLFLLLITTVVILIFVLYMDRESSISSESSSNSDDNTNNRNLKFIIMVKMTVILMHNRLYNRSLNLYNARRGLDIEETNYMRRNVHLLPGCYLGTTINTDIVFRSGHVFEPSISDLALVAGRFPRR